MATTAHADDDYGSEDAPALTVETVRLAHRLVAVVAAMVDLAPKDVLGRRPAAKAAVIRKLSLYLLNGWMSAQTIAKITGFNAAHINREVAQLWRWAENNALIESLVERLESFFVTFPEATREIDELSTEMMLEMAAERARRAADRVSRPAPRAASKPAPRPLAPVRLATLEGARV